MKRPSYLEKYRVDWELFEVILGGKSALDAKSFLGTIKDLSSVESFLKHYGHDIHDPILMAELFGNYQEAMQFIKKYFLKEGNEEGLPLEIPPRFHLISDLSELFLMAAGQIPRITLEERLWSGIILKVMHTILHADKDLRHNYLPVIQQQIFDQFYKALQRGDDGKLYFVHEQRQVQIPLYDFQTKAKKSRESIVLKLLHKPENVAEEVFDRIGVRFITLNKADTLLLIKFLDEKHNIIPQNLKPSRSVNSLLDVEKFKGKYGALVRKCIKEQLSEEEFYHLFNESIMDSAFSESDDKRIVKNGFSHKKYRSIQFTCRQLINYRHPFIQDVMELKTMAKKQHDNGVESELSKKALELDLGLLRRDVRFFYPFEVQIVDYENYLINTEGEASHEIYKKAQLEGIILRLFKPLLEYKHLSFGGKKDPSSH